jgi:3-dehydroquinate synthase
MRTLNLPLGPRSYSIHIGEGLLSQKNLLANSFKRPRAAVITNETVAPLYLDRLLATLQDLEVEAFPVILPDGEAFKDWNTLNRIFDALLAARCDRSTTLVALGGGVIGDMTGFAAAVYQRGVPFIQVPTTLLSQVDSSVGGKTAINHPRGKNMIGAFYQPRLVLADTTTLRTLPERELQAGLAEVIKYGLIRDRPFLDWLDTHIPDLRAQDPTALAYAIERSCQNKADVVMADETEQGERALLNLGHTFGHAIETGMGYGTWLHGEAVAAGTLMAADLSHRLGYLTSEEVAFVERLFEKAGLPLKGPGLSPERYLELMAHDKKVDAGKLRLVLLTALGKAALIDTTPETVLRETLLARTESSLDCA